MKPGGLIKVHTTVLQPTSHYKSLLIADETTSDDLLQLLLTSYNSNEPVEQFSLYEVNKILVWDSLQFSLQSYFINVIWQSNFTCIIIRYAPARNTSENYTPTTIHCALKFSEPKKVNNATFLFVRIRTIHDENKSFHQSSKQRARPVIRCPRKSTSPAHHWPIPPPPPLSDHPKRWPSSTTKTTTCRAKCAKTISNAVNSVTKVSSGNWARGKAWAMAYWHIIGPVHEPPPPTVQCTISGKFAPFVTRFRRWASIKSYSKSNDIICEITKTTTICDSVCRQHNIKTRMLRMKSTTHWARPVMEKL